MLESLRNLLTSLKGRKSYLGMIGLGILGLFWSYGAVSDETAKVLGVLLGTWTGVAFRLAIGAGKTRAPEPSSNGEGEKEG